MVWMLSMCNIEWLDICILLIHKLLSARHCINKLHISGEI
jgi:hypothetical protein